MKLIKIYEEEQLNGTITEYVQLERDKGEFTWMLKSTYEAQQAEQSTPIVEVE